MRQLLIERCELCNHFKYVLLTIYFPDKFVSVCDSALMEHYCKRIGIPFNPHEEMVYTNNALIEWKNAVPEIADWSNFILTCFCDWLYKKDMTIDGNYFRLEADTISTQVTQEIKELNIQGESKEAFVKIRINQGVFRDRLLQRYKECCLCGMNNQCLLVASHIKPWSISEPNEKLDSDNGFLMCPNHDKLFGQGWISFDENGCIIISNRLSLENRILLNIKDNMKISLTEKNKKYLHYHRENIFKNNFQYCTQGAEAVDAEIVYTELEKKHVNQFFLPKLFCVTICYTGVTAELTNKGISKMW